MPPPTIPPIAERPLVIPAALRPATLPEVEIAVTVVAAPTKVPPIDE